MTRLVPASKFVGMCALNSCIERFIFVAKSYVLLGKTKKPKTGIFLSYFSLLLFFPVDMFLSLTHTHTHTHTRTHARTHARTYTNTHKHTRARTRTSFTFSTHTLTQAHYNHFIFW